MIPAAPSLPAAANVTVTNLPPPADRADLAGQRRDLTQRRPRSTSPPASPPTVTRSPKSSSTTAQPCWVKDTTAPYTFTWSGVPAGSYSLTARLVYDAGTTLDSTPAANVLVAAPRPDNTPPTITTIADQTTSQDTATPPISFTVGDAETAASNLTVYATSADPAFVPTNNIVFGGSDSNRTVTLTPVSGATGTVAITVFVSDGTLTTNTTFQLAVQAAPSPPNRSWRQMAAARSPRPGHPDLDARTNLYGHRRPGGRSGVCRLDREHELLGPQADVCDVSQISC